jgi:type IV secretion system protein VirB5
MKTRKNTSPTSKDVPENPYLAGRREWMEQNGRLSAAANNWRIVALVTSLIALVAVIGIVMQSSQSKVVPYVVEVDKLGSAVAAHRADVVVGPNNAMIKASLARFIVDVRSVYIDAAALRTNINEAYAMMANGSPAALQMNDYFRANSPFERAKGEVVSVDIEPPMPISADTWRVEWKETTRPRGGAQPRVESWAATITFAIVPPTTEAGIIANPAGLFIKQFTWSQRL